MQLEKIGGGVNCLLLPVATANPSPSPPGPAKGSTTGYGDISIKNRIGGYALVNVLRQYSEFQVPGGNSGMLLNRVQAQCGPIVTYTPLGCSGALERA